MLAYEYQRFLLQSLLSENIDSNKIDLELSNNKNIALFNGLIGDRDESVLLFESPVAVGILYNCSFDILGLILNNFMALVVIAKNPIALQVLQDYATNWYNTIISSSHYQSALDSNILNII